MLTIAPLCVSTKYHWIVHFERMSFVVHELYLNYNSIFKKMQAKVIQLLSKMQMQIPPLILNTQKGEKKEQTWL